MRGLPIDEDTPPSLLRLEHRYQQKQARWTVKVISAAPRSASPLQKKETHERTYKRDA